MIDTLVNPRLKLVLLSFQEEDNYILYAPTLDLSGYGENEIEAKLSFDESLAEFFDFTIKHQTLDIELKKLGWKNDFQAPFLDDLIQKNNYLAEIIREKDFSKTERIYTIPLTND